MSGGQHTPGPWVLHDYGYKFICQAPSHGYITRDICRMDGSTMAAIQQRANARLIAAAPELLEAARLVLDWYEAENDHSKTDFYQRMEMCRASEKALRAAIAKATGSIK